MISEPKVRLPQTMHLSCTDTNTVSKWTEIRLHMPRHLVVPSGAYKPIFEPLVRRLKPCTYLALGLALSPNEPNRASTWASSPRSTIGCVRNDFWAYCTFGANRTPIMHRHYHCLQADQNKIPHDPHHLGVPSGASKMIFEPTVRSTHDVQLSWVKVSTIFKQTESSFHLSLITLEYHWFHPERFLSLWYVWCKSCTYLASKLALSPNKLNRASTWASLPQSTIGCVQNDFLAYCTFGANCAPILHRHQHYLQMDQNKIPHDPRHHGVP
jgi:hypothetical protein